jgi:DNA ligase (NAD+)
LGDQNIRFLFEKGIVKSPVDIFFIEEKNREFRLENFDGWGKLSVENLFASINAAKKISLDKFIYSLGIPQVGRAAAKSIAKFFGTCDAFLNCAKTGSGDELRKILGIGDSIIKDFNAFFADENNLKIVLELNEIANVADAEKSASQILAGRAVVFTGSFEKFSREEAKSLAEKFGGRATGTVSAKTSLVVAGENAGQKLEQAKKLGIKIVSEEEFLEIISYQVSV